MRKRCSFVRNIVPFNLLFGRGSNIIRFNLCIKSEKFSGFLLVFLIESFVHKVFGVSNHSHFSSQETIAEKLPGEKVGYCD